MRRRLIILLCLLLNLFCFNPINANAKNDIKLNDSYTNAVLSNNTYIMAKIDYLGKVEDEDSVAWLLQTILDYVKIIGPILVVILSSVDFITVIVKGDDEAMAKATKKLTTRLILAALLFFIPTLVQVLLNIFGFASDLGGIQ